MLCDWNVNIGISKLDIFQNQFLPQFERFIRVYHFMALLSTRNKSNAIESEYKYINGCVQSTV